MLESSSAEFKEHLQDHLNNYSFESLVSDAFDLLSRYAAGCLFIEKNQYDFPFLAKQYKRYREEFVTAMTDYLNAFMAKGTIRTIDNVEFTTIMIVEILSWWAMDRCYISFEINDIPSEDAKKVCMDNIVTAYKSN